MFSSTKDTKNTKVSLFANPSSNFSVHLSDRIVFFEQGFRIMPAIYRGSCPRAAWIKRGTSVVNKFCLTTFLPSSRCYAETSRHLIPRRDSGQDPRCARAGFSFRSASIILPCKSAFIRGQKIFACVPLLLDVLSPSWTKPNLSTSQS